MVIEAKTSDYTIYFQYNYKTSKERKKYPNDYIINTRTDTAIFDMILFHYHYYTSIYTDKYIYMQSLQLYCHPN